ncbi:MAG: mtDNA inheritance, partitioning of the mitochondrial organelle [Claussenomyces sp. TS43310]|nr:MAG: mtDNA inheritance, partitioning of the mitochondrial organelle [Claussenomyces sp. TS43310]
MHEIITLQLGQRANYLATHFWNTQESYFTYSSDEESYVDHDIHFRPGLGVDGSETYTPRTVIYDLKGGFGSLRKLNALYELQEEGTPEGPWNGPTVVQRQAPIPQSAYQQSLEDGVAPARLAADSVRYWSDFNRVYYHPRSIIQLNEYELNSSLMPFERWTVGEELFNDLDKEHDILDRDLRPFVEEADQMQGIQLMSSLDDAWGGFTARYMDRIRDEYGKTTVWIWGLEDGTKNIPREKQFLRLSNTARSTVEISPQASLYLPITVPPITLPPYVTIDRRSPWHTSALISTASESMTLASRLKTRNGLRNSLDEIAGSLNVNGNQNIAKLQMSIDLQGEPLQSKGGHPAIADESKDPRAPSQDGRSIVVKPATEDDVSLDMDFFPSDEPIAGPGRHPMKSTHVFGQTKALRGTNEPAVEDEDDFDGRERAKRRAAGLPIIHNSSPDKVAVQTSLTSDSAVASRLKNIRNIVNRAIGIEEREALGNSLGEIAEAYEEGWDSGSDDDDD